MLVNVVALLMLCYIVLFWVILCSMMTRRQWQWPPTASFAEASNISASDHDASISVQRKILTAFKQGMVVDGDGALANWKASQPLCSWKGVGCAEGTNRVVHLNLPHSILKGTVTPLLFSMPFLTHLNVSGNRLEGKLPDNISTSFEVLDLSYNRFYGSIPASIGNLANLQWLDLSENHFAGRIPPQLGNLTSLSVLDLLDNWGLEGELPAELRACTKLIRFGVGTSRALVDNRRSLISGPSEAAFAIFSNMSSLQSLVITGTHITGSIPAEIGSLKTLRSLSLDQNCLKGEIPRTLGNLSNLEQLFLLFGDFTGPIPWELGSCTQLQQLHVGMSSNLGVTDPSDEQSDLEGTYFWNNLTGSIPESFGQLQNLRELLIDYTKMGGKIPSFSNATALQRLRLDMNQFTGDIPCDFASSLTLLRLLGNRLSGPIPAAIGNLSNLEAINIAEDHIEGNIPPELVFCQHLISIFIGPSPHNIGTVMKLTGVIPEEFGRLNRLEYLELAFTQVGGTIPSSLGNCSSLTDLTLVYNKLAGSLPPEIANLTALEIFNVQRNMLEGSLSTVRWNELTELTEFVVSQNNLSGTIPESLGTLIKLWYFSARYNQLVGSFPSLTNCSSLRILDLQNNQIEGNISLALDFLPGNSMQIIQLASNRFYGTIPSWIAARFTKLFILVLAGNLLEGTIPPTIWQIYRWQELYGSSDPNSVVARSYTDNFNILFISSKGIMTPFQTILLSFTVLDLSGNNLQGSLPEELFNLSGLSVLNLSRNFFTGEIPRVPNSFSQIDLSHNNLTGEIPAKTLIGSKLEYLDLSSNALCGRIPNLGTKFAATYFTGNPCLCGEPLDVKCPSPLSPSSPPSMSSQIYDGKASVISWTAFSIGSSSAFVVTMMVFLLTSRGSDFIFGDSGPLIFIRRHGLYKEPV